ncbi:MAG: potassium-transporting ATPase subunit C, partial [Candidatus Omnitrophota bacterium]
LQGERVAVARKLPKAQVIELVHRYTKQPQGGFLGAARVNVLKLNIALDDMEKRHGR